MDHVLVDASEIKRIVDKTLETIEQSKNEIYGIVENARAEVERVQKVEGNPRTNFNCYT